MGRCVGRTARAADALAALCAQSAAEFRATVEAEGGPVTDATVTAGTLAELATWLQALAPDACLEVARGPPGEYSRDRDQP